MIWKDISIYEKKKTEQKPFHYELTTKEIRISVFKIKDFDTWFLSCDDLNIDYYDLETIDKFIAMEKAVNTIKSKLSDMLNSLKD